MSKSRQVESSEPVLNAFPSGKNWTALTSDSWPACVCTHFPRRVSHTLAVASQEPETNICRLMDGSTERLMTSPPWSAKEVIASFFSTSQKMQVESPEEVSRLCSSIKRQQDKYPSCAMSSWAGRIADCPVGDEGAGIPGPLTL